MAEIKLTTGLNGMEVTAKSKGTLVPIGDVLKNTDLNLNSRVLALMYHKLGLGDNIPVNTYEGRPYITSDVGEAVLDKIS